MRRIGCRATEGDGSARLHEHAWRRCLACEVLGDGKDEMQRETEKAKEQEETDSAIIAEEKDTYQHNAQRPKEKEKGKEDRLREEEKGWVVRHRTQEKRESILSRRKVKDFSFQCAHVADYGCSLWLPRYN